MNRNPLDRPGRANHVEKLLVLREHVSRRVLHREWNEHYRAAIDRDLECLQFALSQVVRRSRNESVNERIRISPKLPRHSSLWYGAAAHIFDDQDVAPVIRMDAFLAAATQAAIQRA